MSYVGAKLGGSMGLHSPEGVLHYGSAKIHDRLLPSFHLYLHARLGRHFCQLREVKGRLVNLPHPCFSPWHSLGVFSDLHHGEDQDLGMELLHIKPGTYALYRGFFADSTEILSSGKCLEIEELVQY